MLPFPSVSDTSSCSPWAESAPTCPWICFSVTVLPDALLALEQPGAELKSRTTSSRESCLLYHSLRLKQGFVLSC